MEDMMLQAGDMLSFRLTNLPTLKFVKFQPFRWQFSRIKNPKSVLTRELQSSYVTLSKGEIVTIRNDGKRFRLVCAEVKAKGKGPLSANAQAGCIIDTDLTVEFLPPVGKAPETKLLRINSTVNGAVEARKYVYFRVKIVDPYREIKVKFNKIEGSAERKASRGRGDRLILFYSFTNQYVTRSDGLPFTTSAEPEAPPLRSPDGAGKPFPNKWLYLSIHNPSATQSLFSLELSEGLSVISSPQEPEQENQVRKSLGGWGRSRSRSRSMSPGRGRRLSGGSTGRSMGGKSAKGILDSKAIRKARLAALTRRSKRNSWGAAQRVGLTRAERKSKADGKLPEVDKRRHSSIPGLIRQQSSEVRKMRAARKRAVEANLSKTEGEKIAELGKLVFATLMKATSSESKDSDPKSRKFKGKSSTSLASRSRNPGTSPGYGEDVD
uniref:Ubiquitin fusion degradation protein UFD1 N-terminal subdomain 2 domain-containing protein n=1 Tax=Amorphochlora amoebiformis TaxID=1561963 RepID=A0A7S0CVJ1_9EUKA|mmetsp:Transcript_13374/g.21179  ORF Transcript_13374/g.21179 Transcript_13374/m.21179 type:complete len:437 (+) Transcript_13374:2-1312(+)